MREEAVKHVGLVILWVSPGIADADSVLLSRYINHSCAPNCVAEVVTFDKEDKIIIISSRRIPKGEEVRGMPASPATPRSWVPRILALPFPIEHLTQPFFLCS